LLRGFHACRKIGSEGENSDPRLLAAGIGIFRVFLFTFIKEDLWGIFRILKFLDTTKKICHNGIVAGNVTGNNTGNDTAKIHIL